MQTRTVDVDLVNSTRSELRWAQQEHNTTAIVADCRRLRDRIAK